MAAVADCGVTGRPTWPNPRPLGGEPVRAGPYRDFRARSHESTSGHCRVRRGRGRRLHRLREQRGRRRCVRALRRHGLGLHHLPPACWHVVHLVRPWLRARTGDEPVRRLRSGPEGPEPQRDVVLLLPGHDPIHEHRQPDDAGASDRPRIHHHPARDHTGPGRLGRHQDRRPRRAQLRRDPARAVASGARGHRPDPSVAREGLVAQHEQLAGSNGAVVVHGRIARRGARRPARRHPARLPPYGARHPLGGGDDDAERGVDGLLPPERGAVRDAGVLADGGARGAGGRRTNLCCPPACQPGARDPVRHL